MGEHELHALAEPAVVMAHGLGVHSPQLDAAVAVTELGSHPLQAVRQGEVLVGGGQAGGEIVSGGHRDWVCTNILSGHIESGVEARGKLMTMLLSDKC